MGTYDNAAGHALHDPAFDADDTCQVCGGNPSTDPDKGGCDCPECKVCGTVGDPSCYEKHCLIKTYLVDLGNSNEGAVGMCARVKGKTPEEVLEHCKKIFNPSQYISATIEDARVNYLNLYVNPSNITLDDISDPGYWIGV